MLVYVISKDGQPLMPISRCGKVRRLLKSKRAKVIKRCPFTIKLLFEPRINEVQECYCGVDTGSKYIGVAVISNDRVLYQSQIELRTDIKSKVEDRRKFRRNRRSRKTRYRKPRFLNKKSLRRLNRLQPSIRHKVQAHIDEIEFYKKILPVSDLILEVSQFDTTLIKNPSLMNEKVKHWGYQKGFNYGYSSRRCAILHRDNYTCQCCGKKNCRLEVHHIKFKCNGGSDDEENLITLCEECHKKIHRGEIVLNKKPKKMNLKHATHMSIIRSQLLKTYPQAIETFGFVTKANREHLKLLKNHYIDACVIASGGLEFELSDTLYLKRRVSKQDRQLCKGVRGEKKIPTKKLFGFKKFDKVEYLGELCFIKGRRSSGSFVLMDIDNNALDFRDIGGKQNTYYKSIKIICARRSILCIRRDVCSFNVDWYARVAKKEGISDPVKLMERITGAKVNEKKVTVEDAKVMREATKERFNTEIKDYFDKEQLEAMDYEYDNPLFINKDPVKLAKIAEKYRISKDGAVFIYNEITEGRIQGFYGVDENKLENWDEKTLEKICRSADEVTEIGDLGYMGGLDYDDYYDPDDFIEDLRQEAFVGELSGHRWIGINCDSLNRQD